MDIAYIILILASLCGFLMAFSLGANDVSNSMASAVGAKALTLRQAVIIASILNFFGAVFLGAHVATTLTKGIINPSSIESPYILMLGMFAVLLSSGLWVLIATYTALPVSSTHAVVGSLVGFGLVAGGINTVYWSKLFTIIGAWLLSPFIGALVGYVVFMQIKKTILYSKKMKLAVIRWAPAWCALTLIIVVLSLCFKSPLGMSLKLNWIHGLVISFVVGIVTFYGTQKLVIKTIYLFEPAMEATEEVFKKMQVATACFVSLSHGANDVSNAIAPVVAIYYIALDGHLLESFVMPTWLLAFGGLGIALGTVVLGHKVMSTVGERITQINNSRGFAISFSSASTTLMAANLGIPISTTHATVGSVVGVGLARGLDTVDFRVLGKILSYWVLTVPISGFSCILIYHLLLFLFPV